MHSGFQVTQLTAINVRQGAHDSMLDCLGRESMAFTISVKFFTSVSTLAIASGGCWSNGYFPYVDSNSLLRKWAL